MSEKYDSVVIKYYPFRYFNLPISPFTFFIYSVRCITCPVLKVRVRNVLNKNKNSLQFHVLDYKMKYANI